MINPAEGPASTPLHLAYAAELRVHAIMLIWLGYRRLSAPSLRHAEEDDITGELLRGMRLVLQDSTSPDWVDHYELAEQVPQNVPGKRGKRRPRMDIEVARHERGPRPCLGFEAKRLGRGETISGYAGGEGLGAFLSGYYPTTHGEAGMLGYVQEKSSDEWSAKLAEELSVNSVQHRLVKGGELEDFHVELTMVRKHGDSILYFGGVRQVRRWRALQTELVAPNKLPDGLLEVYFHGRSTPDYFLLEIATCPEKRALEQALKDLTLAYQHLHVLPELLTIVLYPRGKFRLTGDHALKSRLEWSQLACRWKVVELWQLAAEDLLAAGDVGLVPWVPLTRFQGPPAPLLEECRRRIDKLARPEEHDNLLAVSQVLVQLRYNDPKLLQILGGKRVMLESPLIKEIVAENTQKARQDDILGFLQARFGSVPDEIAVQLRNVSAHRKLKALIKYAAQCPDLQSFRRRLS